MVKKRRLHEAYEINLGVSDPSMLPQTSVESPGTELPFMANRKAELEALEQEEVGCPMVVPNIIPVMQELLAGLRGLHWEYYTMHWQSKGYNFYGEHLMFQRLYEDIPDFFDTLAERMVAFYGINSVDSTEIMGMAYDCLSNLYEKADPYVRSLEIVEKVLLCISKAIETLERANVEQQGWDDYLPALAAKLEEHKYLLLQPMR